MKPRTYHGPRRQCAHRFAGAPGWCLLLVFAGAVPSPAADVPADLPPDHAERFGRGLELFGARVRSILTERCVPCHGGEATKSDFDLTTREGLLQGGSGGRDVVPWSAGKSRLIALIGHREEPHMPSKAPRLAEGDIAAIAAWIDLGAPYERPLVEKPRDTAKGPMVVTDKDREFWSFRPLTRPDPPPVRDGAWCRTPIDSFLLAKLEETGLAPSGPASRETLIRRLSFDLVGLPPSPEEIQAFIDDSSSDAYEKLVQRLLASPRFGERWARHWLDVVRFAESHGFEHDTDRPHAYPYRDFVIRAFNADLPYDTFIKWQIAGDEIEPEDPMALMATGFLAAGVHATQITANQVEKERYDELDDMTRTLGTAMLGLTVGCARCHDHKFDPIPTRDYYRLLSTFTATVRSEMDVNMEPAEHRAAKARFDAEHAPLVRALEDFDAKELPPRLDSWLLSGGWRTERPRWIILDPVEYRSEGGAEMKKLPDGSLLAAGKNPDFDVYEVAARTGVKGISAVRIEALAHESLVKGGPGRAANGNIALSDFRVSAAAVTLGGGEAGGPAKPTPVKLVSPRATFEQAGLPVAAAIDADPKSAWALDPEFGKDHAAVFETEAAVGFEGGTALVFRLEFKNNRQHSIGRLRISAGSGAPPFDPGGASMPESVGRILGSIGESGPGALGAGDRAVLFEWYRGIDPARLALARKVEAHLASAPRPKLTKVLISSEGVPAVRLHTQGGDFLEETHFLKRGDPNQKEGVADQGFPQVLVRAPDMEKRWQAAPPAGWRTSYRRLSLARWITDVDAGAGHLLARVIVNRLWQHHMGRGIVQTPSDFGFQGERPTHPELLDWLASELIRGGWRLKRIHELIVTSAAYMQGSALDPARAAADPENRLHGRRSPRRLQAEVIRDAILAASGLLDETMFGPGTLDPNHRRRSIYFFVKRSRLTPMMVLFDGPDALQGIDRRPATTVAPQGLFLMNSPLVEECAEAFARRVAPAPGEALEASVRKAYRIALGRLPAAEELRDALDFLREQSESYAARDAERAGLLALADLCQGLFSLNEFIYIE